MPIKKIKITDEIWKDVEGFEGIYQVSNLGRVRSLDRIVPAICHTAKGYKWRYADKAQRKTA